VATKARVNSLVATLGTLQGTLRAIHLAAHLDTTAVLHPWQIGRYTELRGYYIASTAPQHVPMPSPIR
jgi:hypothetical protein